MYRQLIVCALAASTVATAQEKRATLAYDSGRQLVSVTDADPRQKVSFSYQHDAQGRALTTIAHADNKLLVVETGGRGVIGSSQAVSVLTDNTGRCYFVRSLSGVPEDRVDLKHADLVELDQGCSLRSRTSLSEHVELTPDSGIKIDLTLVKQP